MARAAGTADQHLRLARAMADVDPPYAVVDLTAFDANAAFLLDRAAGTPIRVASKSLRCRALLRRTLERPGFAGVLAFTLPEALWLAIDHDNVVVGYPTAHRGGLRALAADPEAAARVTLMIDAPEQLDLIDAVVGDRGHELRVCLDLDASLWLAGGRIRIGARRSPVRGADAALALAHRVAERRGFRLVGLMSYEAQVAGVGDRQAGAPLRNAAIRLLQHRSMTELAERRAEVVAAVRSVAPLEFVNGGGTGSLDRTAREPAITEVAAGSGLYAPALFDSYRSLSLRPAALFTAPVCRRPGPGVATVNGAGWLASGAADRARLPMPTYPRGLSLTSLEGAGEVQTPLTGRAADRLAIGDPVWFRHAKAGELAERVTTFYLVDGAEIVDEVPTYRGEGQAFL